MSADPKPTLREGDLFAGRYRITRFLGEGGMGRVYEASDTRLEERVALKLLNINNKSDKHLTRFRQEVRLARRITHPNVARTHDIGESDGHHFLTMELIDGGSLDELIEDRMRSAGMHRGPFTPHHAVSLTVPIALGLHAAHCAGVVHRDLKPANVMVRMDEDQVERVVITDFGVARALDTAATRATAALGTPIYMAPEQILGEETGPFSDIYSLGMVLYELLTGQLPFTGATPMAIALARCRVPPTDPREHADMAAPLAEIVLRCLDMDASSRFATADDVASRLSRFVRAGSANTVMVRPVSSASASVAASPSASATTSRSISNPFAPISPGKRTLAIMPFVYRGPPDLNYLGDSLTQELIDTLSRTKGLRVLGFGATSRLRDSADDPRDVGHALGADVIVSANLQATSDRVRVSARLVDVHSSVQLWSGQFDKRFEDVFEMQDIMSKRVAHALRVELTLIEHQWRATAEATALYLRARKFLDGRQMLGGQESVELLNRCLDLSPDFAPAYAARAIAAVKAWWMDIVGHDSTVWHERSKAFVAAAQEHADELAETHLAAAMYAIQMGRFQETATELADALAIAPTLPEAHRYLADLQCEAGRLDEGVKRARLAVELEPTISAARFCIMRYYALTGRWDDCDAEYESLREIHGGHHTPLMIMRVRFSLWKEDIASVQGLIDHMLASSDPVQQMVAGFCRYVTGESDDSALKVAMGFFDGFGNVRLSSLTGQIAVEAYAAQGNDERALEILVNIADEALIDVSWFERCPLLESLRSTPEGQVALTKVRNRAHAIWEIKPADR